MPGFRIKFVKIDAVINLVQFPIQAGVENLIKMLNIVFRICYREAGIAKFLLETWNCSTSRRLTSIWPFESMRAYQYRPGILDLFITEHRTTGPRVREGVSVSPP